MFSRFGKRTAVFDSVCPLMLHVKEVHVASVGTETAGKDVLFYVKFKKAMTIKFLIVHIQCVF